MTSTAKVMNIHYANHVTRLHRDCKKIQTLDDVISNIKTSVIFENVYSDLEEARKTIMRSITDQEKNHQNLLTAKRYIINEIKESTEKLINHLIKIKLDLQENVNNIVTEQENEMSKTTELLESSRLILEEIIEQKESMMIQASNLQAFLAIKEMENIVKKSKENIIDLNNSGKLDHVDIEFCKNKTENEILKFNSMGDVKIKKSPYTLSFITNKGNEAQALSNMSSPVILSHQRQFQLEKGRYCGCCLIPTGIMAFADTENHILNLVNADGKPHSKIIFKRENKVYDVTHVDNDLIAVSHSESKKISIVDSVNNKVLRTLSTRFEPRGIVHTEGDILFCVPYLGIMKINIKDESVIVIQTDTSVYYNSVITANKSRICYTSRDRDLITVLDHQYIVLFEFKDEKMLKGPFGITMDQNSYIYAIGDDSKNMVVISSDGKRCHQLLCDANGLHRPLALHYDHNTDQIIIVDYNEMKTVVLKYHVTKCINF